MAFHRLLHIRTNVVRAGGNPNTDLFCQGCKQAKPVDQFYVNRAMSHGRMSNCKPCHRAYQAARIIGKRTKAA